MEDLKLVKEFFATLDESETSNVQTLGEFRRLIQNLPDYTELRVLKGDKYISPKLEILPERPYSNGRVNLIVGSGVPEQLYFS